VPQDGAHQLFNSSSGTRATLGRSRLGRRNGAQLPHYRGLVRRFLVGQRFSVLPIEFVHARASLTRANLRQDGHGEYSRINIPLGSGQYWPSAEIAKLIRPVANYGFESALDLAIMVLTGVVAPSSGDFVACSMERVANMAAVPT